MSAELKQLREDCKAGKKTVSRCADRIKVGITKFGYTKETLYNLVLDLEREFQTFLNAFEDYQEQCDTEGQTSEDFIQINKMNFSQYSDSVAAKFSEGKSAFDTFILNSQASSDPQIPQTPVQTGPPTQPTLLKKFETPVFNGFHKTWPEFSSVWLKIMPAYVKNKTVLAHILKDSCKGGPGKEIIAHISAGAENAYDLMWAALEEYFGNVTLCVTAALSEIKDLPSVREGDLKGTVRLIRGINQIYLQLQQVKQVNMVTAREVNDLLLRLPPNLRREWGETYTDLDHDTQLHPLESFHAFLQKKLKVAQLMSDLDSTFQTGPVSSSNHVETGPVSCSNHVETQYPNRQRQYGAPNHVETQYPNRQRQYGAPNQYPNRQRQYGAPNHVETQYPNRQYETHNRQPSQQYGTSNRQPSRSPRPRVLEPCVIHPGSRTHSTSECNVFKSMSAAEQLKISPVSQNKCNANAVTTDIQHDVEDEQSEPDTELQPENRPADADAYSATTASSSATALKKRGCLAIYSTPVASSNLKATTFCDPGSDTSFISEKAVKNFQAKKLSDSINLTMTTLHGTRDIPSSLYQVTLVTVEGKKTDIVAYSRPTISSDVAELDLDGISKVFPDVDVRSLRRPKGPVDILIGADYFSLHPKHEVMADGDLSIMRGELGVCVQGSHPLLQEDPMQNEYDNFHARTSISRQLAKNISDFILCDQLGTEITPKCGSCRCGHCPIPGHTYSFNEEQELEMIKRNLKYIENSERWRTSYPWKTDPIHLPDNYPAALATLISTEKKLRSDPVWAKTFSEQIAEHEERGVARKLTAEEIASWKGPKYYLSAMAVEQPKSLTTPVRLVMNSSQMYRGVSLNSFLAKGPDAFNNSLLGLLLLFRENLVVLIGDIRKMFNSVELEELECHVHRFLWRDLENRPPDIWCITRVNLGDRPSGTIAIAARDMTAEKFRHINPQAADMITNQTYTDDTVESVPDLTTAKELATGASQILQLGGFKYKEWVFGGANIPYVGTEPHKNVLGTTWDRSDDTVVFPSKLNFSPKKRNIRTEPNVTIDTLDTKIPELTRRIVLEQVMGVYDPYGFLSPLMLKAKILLRETWVLNLKWDDVLPETMQIKWRLFFRDILLCESLKYPRCLRPENSVGDPSLIILSDGSDLAYGCAAYIQWDLPDGSCWSRLILAKTRIAPINRICTPQMELNGAVTSTRIRKFVEKHTRYTFKQVIQLVDSITVLQQIHSLSTRFKVYEGVRVGEIQSATNGDLSSWAWISGAENIADWATRVKSPAEIGPDSAWFNGPEFMRKPIHTWNIKFKPVGSTDPLPGEKPISSSYACNVAPSMFHKSLVRNTDIRTVRGAYALILAALRNKSFNKPVITPELLVEADLLLIKDAQSEWTAESIKVQFRTLHPVLQNDVYVVGTRISHRSPLTPENKPQSLLPSKCLLTQRLMAAAHNDSCHHGRDKTLARFRAKYWTAHASKIASSTCAKCQMCKLIRATRVKQEMGYIPAERLMPAPPFNASALDLFGPFYVRGEVQKKTTGKAWGLILTDICCRAVHIEVVHGYSTEQFMLGLSRFAALRGWPSIIYSDPGSQLKGAEADLRQIWESIDLTVLQTLGAQKGLKWSFGPTDGSWYQGTVESLIKTAKKAISLAVGNSRLSGPELLTVMTETANLINERPIGYIPSNDSVISVLTPNSLLLGRSTSINPGGYEPNPSLRSRVTLIQQVTDQFWQNWTRLYAPTLVNQSKWRSSDEPLRVDDVVMVMDSNLLKSEYRLARVHETIKSSDGRIRRVKVAYKNFKVGESLKEYKGAPDKIVERAVQSLSLLAPTKNN